MISDVSIRCVITIEIGDWDGSIFYGISLPQINKDVVFHDGIGIAGW